MSMDGWRWVGMVSAGLLALDASAGKLNEFAKTATGQPAEQPKPAAKPQAYDSAETAAFGSGTLPSSGGEGFLASFIGWLVSSPMNYRHDDPSAALADADAAGSRGPLGFFPRHEPGEATVPYARLDYNWQYVDENIDADDLRVELGYKPFAVHARKTMYADASDGFELDINQIYGVLRYGGSRPDFVPGTFEAGIGLGASQLETNEDGIPDESDIALTFPLKYYPADWFGVEFRPAWYTWAGNERIGDYDLSASVGWRFVQLRGGYRWMRLSGETWNDGPYAGLSASF